MKEIRPSGNTVVRKIGLRKDNRAVIYLPRDFVIAPWVIVRREGEKIVMEPIKIEKR